jgi:hypothetical protein
MSLVTLRDWRAAVVSRERDALRDRSRTTTSGARLFASLASENINLLMIAQGSSEVNISVLITEKEDQRAVRAVHAAFGLGDPLTDEHKPT